MPSTCVLLDFENVQPEDFVPLKSLAELSGPTAERAMTIARKANLIVDPLTLLKSARRRLLEALRSTISKIFGVGVSEAELASLIDALQEQALASGRLSCP